jgi:hypothetical protein
MERLIGKKTLVTGGTTGIKYGMLSVSLISQDTRNILLSRFREPGMH